MTELVSMAVVGAGNRGQTYADLAAADGRAQVVAVADPDCARREELADRHAVSADRRFDGWEALVGGPRIADMVVVATKTASTTNRPSHYWTAAITCCSRSPLPRRRSNVTPSSRWPSGPARPDWLSHVIGRP